MLLLRPLENIVLLLRPLIPSGLFASEFPRKFLSIFLISQACCCMPQIFFVFDMIMELKSGKYIYDVLLYVFVQQ